MNPVRPHQVSACSPAKLRAPDLATTPDRRMLANERVWAWAGDAEKAAFHRVVCLRHTRLGDAKLASNLHTQLRAEIGLHTLQDLMVEFDLPALVNNDPALVAELREKLALWRLPSPLEPVGPLELEQRHPGHHIKVVSRVCDDDLLPPPYPELALRRRVDECGHCQYPCWVDDKSTIAAETMVMLCIACTRMDYIDKLRAKGLW